MWSSRRATRGPNTCAFALSEHGVAPDQVPVARIGVLEQAALGVVGGGRCLSHDCDGSTALPRVRSVEHRVSLIISTARV